MRSRLLALRNRVGETPTAVGKARLSCSRSGPAAIGMRCGGCLSTLATVLMAERISRRWVSDSLGSTSSWPIRPAKEVSGAYLTRLQAGHGWTTFPLGMTIVDKSDCVASKNKFYTYPACHYSAGLR